MKIKVLPIGSIIVLLLLGGLTIFAYGQEFSDWTAPVNVQPPVNTAVVDADPFVTKDGLSLYFTRASVPNATFPNDLWVAHRATIDDAWGPPEPLPSTINRPASNESGSWVSNDGHWLYFNSNRAGGFGRNDLYVSWRSNKKMESGSGGWQPAVNLGSGVNSAAIEQAPTLFEDEATGVITLYFNSNRVGSDDIFASTMQPDGSFGPAEPVEELNTEFSDRSPSVSHNGLEIYFGSDRPGSQPYPLDDCCGPAGEPSEDIWVATRGSTLDPWSEPQPVTELNSPYYDDGACLSFDGESLYLHSPHRAGNVSDAFDIWMATRTKVHPEQ